MKILMLSLYFSPHIGGVEKHVYRVAKKLVERGHSVHIITIKHDRSLPTEESLDGISIYRFEKKDQGRRELKRMLGWLFRERRRIEWADVVHCHDYYTFHYWYLPFRFLYFLKPVFITFHGYEPGEWRRKKNVWLRRIDARLVRGNIAIGDFIQKWYGTRPTFVTYGGVDSSPETAFPKEAAVFVGRLAEDTGILAYLEALRLLRDDFGIDLPMEVCGDGPLRERAEEMARGAGLKVRFHGFVKEPAPYLRSCRLAFVSGYLSILEAMAHRRRVFAWYDTPIKKDYLEMMPDAGRMMSISGDLFSLAKSIAGALQSPESGEPELKAAGQFAARHSWDRMADLYLALYGAEKDSPGKRA